MNSPIKTKVAIACQGGGSQTAFTAGVLKALCESHLQDEFVFVGLSGTSGGALCATLVWYALRKGEQPAWRRLIEFWHDNTAQSHPELLINNMAIEWMPVVNRGMLPMFQTSPSSPLVKVISQFLTAGQRREFSDFPALFRCHIDFDELAALINTQHALPAASRRSVSDHQLAAKDPEDGAGADQHYWKDLSPASVGPSRSKP
jgi:NTE family protein